MLFFIFSEAMINQLVKGFNGTATLNTQATVCVWVGGGDSYNRDFRSRFSVLVPL